MIHFSGIISALIVGLIIGFRHSTDGDHVVAVSTSNPSGGHGGANTGSGGGGSGSNSTAAGNGGSGIVIVRYL